MRRYPIYRLGFPLRFPLRSFLTVLCCVWMVACTPIMSINVNAIVDSDLNVAGKRFVIASDMPEVSENDLYFKEFSRYFAYALGKQGYTQSATRAEADLEIRLKYGVSDGRAGVRHFSIPIYEHVGGETISITETDADGRVTVKRTVTIPTRVQRVGTDIESRSFTLFNRTASLRARKLTPNQGDKPDSEQIHWQIHLQSVSENNDLRQIMPFFATAMIPFVGKNSGQQQQFDFKVDDPSVRQLIDATLPQASAVNP